jgi:hypothetical protein
MRLIIPEFKGTFAFAWVDFGTGDMFELYPLKAAIWAIVGFPLDKDIFIVGGILYYL